MDVFAKALGLAMIVMVVFLLLTITFVV